MASNESLRQPCNCTQSLVAHASNPRLYAGFSAPALPARSWLLSPGLEGPAGAADIDPALVRRTLIRNPPRHSRTCMDRDVEPIHVIKDWYDGPRTGVAEYRGEPHWYRSVYLDNEQWDPDE